MAHMTAEHSIELTTELVRLRIQHKQADYASYGFCENQLRAMNIFFDLTQEFDDLEHIHILAVQILENFFSLPAELYLKDESGELALVTPPLFPKTVPPLHPEIWNDGTRCHIPVRDKTAFAITCTQEIIHDDALLGTLIVDTAKAGKGFSLDRNLLLFLEKFANRVGFCLHNKMLANKNEKHLLFLRKLAHDIGHNIITPNMRLKHLLNQLEGQIASMGQLAESPPDEAFIHDIKVLHRKMSEHTKAILGTFKNSALFLESLLRQSHFDFGHYVLRRIRLDICKSMVEPQFERYRALFEERNIEIDEKPPLYPAEPCMAEADLGLVSQVLANYLSNAVKYSCPPAEGQRPRVRCFVTFLPDAFASGKDGIKVSVFSTGPHIPANEAKHLFDDNFRASNSSGQYGTGHGLYFVREIMTEHHGTSGYEPVDGGNLFFFILPASQALH